MVNVIRVTQIDQVPKNSMTYFYFELFSFVTVYKSVPTFSLKYIKIVMLKY